MPEQLFQGMFDSDLTTVISVTDFLLCLGVSLVLGLVMAFVYMIRTRYTKSFVVTLALLPAVVCVVIMLVNGNTIVSWTPELSFNVIIISSPDIVSGETYTITAGNVSGEIQAS